MGKFRETFCLNDAHLESQNDCPFSVIMRWTVAINRERNMTKRFFAALALIAPLTLAACASGGNESIKNETAATVDSKIHDGVTTKEQVRALYGDPVATDFTDSGHEKWTYTFTNSASDASNFIPVYGDLRQGSHGTEKHLTVIFNGDVVWHHSMNSSAVKGKSGLF